MFPYLVLIFAVQLLSSWFNTLRSYSNNVLRERTNPHITRVIYLRLASLGIERLEDPEITNNINRIKNTSYNVLTYFTQGIQLISYSVSFVVSLALLSLNFPILAPVVIFAALPAMLHDKKQRSNFWSFVRSTTEKSRHAWSNTWWLNDPQKLQEITTVQAVSFLDNRYWKFINWNYAKVKKIYNKWYFHNESLRILSIFAYFFSYVHILSKLALNKLTVGAVFFNIRLVERLSSDFESVTSTYNNLIEYTVKFKEAYAFFQMEPAFSDGKIVLPSLQAGPEIDINNVTFAYPKSEKAVIENFSLNIKPGEKVAVVGHNGAGKTTIAKLLARFYLPISGEILIDGNSIVDIDSASLYKNLSILFQEFNMYGYLTVRENVAVGGLTRDVDDEKIITALKQADAWDFVSEYSKGLDQILTPRFKGGIRPSTGQWQKIAIARFFYRDAPLIIFDEPTAAIDAVSEYNIFNKIYDFFEGKTVILISHRFSTVRNADRIIVVENGKIIEQGSHEDLLDLDGYYAKSFKLQAEGYSMEKTETIA